MSSSTIDELSARYGSNYRWLVMLTGMIGNMALIITSTIINVAIPDIMGAFGIGQDKAQWLATGFLTTMTLSMLLNSWMVGAIGRRATYLLAMAVFVTGSVLGGMSTSFEELVFSRLLQGAGAGLIQPLALQIIFEIFPPDQRGRAMGFFGFGVVLAPALGPAAGGILVDAFNWRAVFFMVLPFCAIGSFMAVMFMPGRDERDPRPAFDWTGLVLMIVFLAALLTGLSNGARDGWGSNVILGRFALAALAIAGFVAWEARCAHPLLNLKLFASARFSAATAVSFVWGAGIFGIWYLVPLFVQLVQGYTPTRAGLLLMPAGIILSLLFPISGRISDRVAPHIPIMGGMAITAFGAYLMSSADIDTPFWLFAWWLIIGRAGLGFVFPALTAGALRALPADLVGQGAGAMSYFRQLGGAFGVNLLATTVASRTAMYGEAMVLTQTAANPATSDFLRTMQGYLAQAGTPEALQLPAAMFHLAGAIQAQATMLAFRDGFLLVGLVFAFAMIPAWLIGRTRPD